MNKNTCTSFDQLQDDPDKYNCYYNFKRTNQGYQLQGKIPCQKFLYIKRKLALPELG